MVKEVKVFSQRRSGTSAPCSASLAGDGRRIRSGMSYESIVAAGLADLQYSVGHYRLSGREQLLKEHSAIAENPAKRTSCSGLP
jgi:hypothetical protein